MDEKVMLTAAALTKDYGRVRSADAISFSINQGEVVGLLGANGAGKSTLMNLLTGCIAPSAGSVTVAGVDLHRHPRSAKLQIGYLPEIPPLYVEMTVAEQLTFAAALRSVAPRDRRREVDRVCALTHVGDMRHRLIRQLSKGYRQRVGIAQSMIANPALLILDEPTAGLDPQQILDIRNLILSLRQQHTILISSHILSEIASVCGRLLILKQGRLVADGTPAQLGQSHGGGGSALDLRIKGSEAQVRSLLSPLIGITELQPLPAAEPGFSDMRVTCEAGVDLREAIVMTLAQAGCPAVLIKPAGATLEEVFIRLTA
ncbi:MAG: ABC transporter ATP-binding protein [Variovorax sp.]